jgi:hypothetical protein
MYTFTVPPDASCQGIDSTMVFVLEKKPSFSKGQKAYRFRIDGKGNCLYEILLPLKNKSAYRTTLADSSAKILYEKISEISWEELALYSKPSLDNRQPVLIQYYSSATGKKNIRVPDCHVVPELFAIESLIENIISTTKWNKINHSSLNH